MQIRGIILKGIGGFYTVKTEAKTVECTLRGIFRKDNITPMVGDLVEITPPSTPDDEGHIIKIFERKNEMIRPPVSNVDQVVAVIAAKSPSPDLLLIDKLLVTLESKRITAIVCINKIDLDDTVACEIAKTYQDIGYPVLSVSALKKLGIDSFSALLKDKTTAFAGNSGVGKSSILNVVSNEFSLKTGDVSEKIQRGRHTTRHVELLELKQGGFVLDTPGFSSFDLENIKKEELASFFPEIGYHAAGCRFKTCRHLCEPDCSVKEALENGMISKSRYQNYAAIYKILSEIPDYKTR